MAPAAGGHGSGAQGTAPLHPEHTVSGYGGSPHTRGGHPEQREAGGGWGTGALPAGYEPRRGPVPGAPGPVANGPVVPPPRGRTTGGHDGARAPRQTPSGAGPSTGPGAEGGPRTPSGPGTDTRQGSAAGTDTPGTPDSRTGSRTDSRSVAAVPGPRRAGSGRTRRADRGSGGGKGRTFTGIAAAAVTTVLAVVVAGQVAADGKGGSKTSATGAERGDTDGSASRSDARPTPARKPAVKPPAPTYEQLMATPFQIDPGLTADGVFEAVPGFDKAPGKGRKIRYRVDVEKGLGLDGVLFATAVQRTLNDERSWANGGAMTFERISSGDPEFVVTLASPGTTDEWCAKSGLNTSIDKVSCDSASTDRVMINAYRWAQGSDTYGLGAIFAYRQMLINHEVGHRLGHGHVSCRTRGALAPVMQQQTKSLNIDGIACRPNPWVHPKG
ncbi:DUF3152 domain-containing protein [Streptomyces sp. NPDC051018]|uniref:DUF3152 domain-containing protein n=1 Tax=Streptomyces sp. NPDC051018 TaxID=3365639 RepID=UPI00379BDAB7